MDQKMTEIAKYNEILCDLQTAFPESFVKYNTQEFIAYPETNAYFSIKNCVDRIDFECKVIEFLSREAFKSEPFYSERKNERYHKQMLDGINKFMGTEYTEDDMEIIYQKFGNGVRHEELREWLENGGDVFSISE